MNFKMECQVRPKYPIYVALKHFDADVMPGQIFTIPDGHQWSNPTLPGSPRAFCPAEIIKMAESGVMIQLSTYLKDCPWVKWELVE